jgi:hypothetical protein
MVGVNAPGWNARKPACAKTSTQFTHVFSGRLQLLPQTQCKAPVPGRGARKKWHFVTFPCRILDAPGADASPCVRYEISTNAGRRFARVSTRRVPIFVKSRAAAARGIADESIVGADEFLHRCS